MRLEIVTLADTNSKYENIVNRSSGITMNNKILYDSLYPVFWRNSTHLTFFSAALSRHNLDNAVTSLKGYQLPKHHKVRWQSTFYVSSSCGLIRLSLTERNSVHLQHNSSVVNIAVSRSVQCHCGTSSQSSGTGRTGQWFTFSTQHTKFYNYTKKGKKKHRPIFPLLYLLVVRTD